MAYEFLGQILAGIIISGLILIGPSVVLFYGWREWRSNILKSDLVEAELAIAIDGLTDRTRVETGLSKVEIRRRVTNLCLWPSNMSPRLESLNRVRGVANAYKHANLDDPTLPISSESDVLVVGSGYGLDGYGVGKYSGIEVIVRDKEGVSWKFLGDVPVALAAWFRFLSGEGATFPSGPYQMCDRQLHP